LSNPPQVSVIVPLFNGEATIQRSLDSVVAQTIKDIEIIAVDDASTDGSGDVVTRWGSGRVTLLRHPQNRGAAAARNTGVAAARGRGIAFLDSDDAWKPDKLARQQSELTQAGDGVAACATGFDLHRDGRTLPISLNFRPPDFRHEILFGCTISPGSTLMVERRIFDEIGGFDEAFRRLEDWDWLLRYSERYQMAFVAEPLADVYVTASKPSLTNQRADPVLDGIQRIGTKHMSRLGSWTERMQLQSSLLFERGAALYRRRRPLAATLYVLAALSLYPMRNLASFRTLWQTAGARVSR
jgi:glycosyltransferase involved in cell wall biosynthesis